MNPSLLNILVAKAARVFVFGLASIMTPVYIAILGYSPFYVGLAVATTVAGNIFSNIMLTRYGRRIGLRRILLLFSFLMLGSGLVLFWSTYFPLILFACFIGNTSTTGTEAGPFQSIETGILPNFITNKTGRAFGVYNLVGYVASSLGALAASSPSHFGDSIVSFHYLYLLYGMVGLILALVYLGLRKEELGHLPIGTGGVSKQVVSTSARQDISKLSILYGMDAFGGGFVSQSLLSFWFYYYFKVSLGTLGIIFFVANVITAASIILAPLLAERMGNLRTMVLTHLISNSFLLGIPIAGSLALALAFLFLRQSLSQMDVPTRQTFMIEIFGRDERVTANAITNTARSAASIFGSPITGALLSAGLYSIPIMSGALSKIFYDVSIFLSYRKRAR